MTSEYAVLSSCSADKMTFDKDDKYIIEIEMVNMQFRYLLLGDGYFCRVSHGQVEQILGMRRAPCCAFESRGRIRGCGLLGVAEVTKSPVI